MKYAVIGNPIAHSLSPTMHNANFDALNNPSSYEAINISEDQFHLIKEIIDEKALSDLMRQFLIKKIYCHI